MTDFLDINERATQWFVQLRDDAVSPEEKTEFQRWLDADPAHGTAYAEVERLWSGLDQIKVDELHESKEYETAFIATRQDQRRWSNLAVACCFVLALFGGLWLSNPYVLTADHRTSPGQQRQITLEDGTKVFLNTDSALSVDITDSQRLIKLHKGEAYFEVARDTRRPFTVVTANSRTQALGTAFAVRYLNDTAQIIVTESKVSVSGSVSSEAGRSLIVTAGYSVSVSESRINDVLPTSDTNALAWRKGRLVFNNQPLAKVLAELERYRRGQIFILNEHVAALPVTGSFELANTNNILDKLELTLPIDVRRFSNLVVLIDADH